MANKIFIQIASYRDNQLIPTIRDCIEKSCHPNNLVFCIAWQHSTEDSWDIMDEYANDARFKIIDIDYRSSQGVCWARNAIQQYYNGEQYTLQLDSHHRFVTNWDVLLITMIKDLQQRGHAKPLITTYLPSFNPETDPQSRVMEPWKLNFDRFTPEGVIFFLPAVIDNYSTLTLPIATRFYSAHFCFTLGSFCVDVQHDPNLYFHGEEISIAVRAYTHGYDLFTPHKLIAWHEYTRIHRKKHWDDNANWVEKNQSSLARLRKLLAIDGTSSNENFGLYGLGTTRTIADYERYAGICFRTRGVQQYTLDHKAPPNPRINNALYDKSFVNMFKHCINIHEQSVPLSDYDFWAVIFEDDNGNSIFREDLMEQEIHQLEKTDGFFKIWKTFNYNKKPHKYIVWPHSKALGWCTKIESII